jgi:dolichyl-phosphate beta-glucosyltransferase
VIPAYNQRRRTRQAAAESAEFLARHFGETAELVVVDDGSLPGEVVDEGELPPGTSLICHPQNRGKGGAVQSGVRAARGDFIVFTDSDLPFSLDPIPTTLAWLREGADIVIGDRLLAESRAETEVAWARRLSSVVFTFMVNRLVGLALPDTQCGYKGYRAAVAKRLFERLEVMSFAFDVEILIRARKAGYQVRRQPLRLVHNEDSSVSLSRHAPRMFLDTFRIAWRARRGSYG